MRPRLLLALGWVLVVSCSDGTATGNTDGAGGSADGDTPDGEAARVIAVFDGDSMLVETAGGEREVRLAGVNAPETGECFAAEATQRLIELAGGEVTLVTVPGEDNEDQFGRLLRDVWAGGVWLNGVAVEEGTAMVLYTGRVGQEELSAAGDRAWANRLGMWGITCGPAPVGIEIADLVFDPP
ncbi:MAG: thermonuclease family protein, partial [Actinomycetota bacterium]|nr:thermonuclease family protein [Actinomycetota bacterium]